MKKTLTRSFMWLAVLLCAPGLLLANSWDESIDGDLSDDELAPTFFALDAGSNPVVGTIGGPSASSPPDDFFDAISFTVNAGDSLAIFLDSYVTSGGNTSSGFNIFNGAGTFIGNPGGGMTPGNVGSDMLALGGLSPLPADTYTIGMREGTVGQMYGLNFQYTPVPEPTSLGLMALVGALCLVRRK